MASAHLDARNLSLPLHATVAPQASTLALEGVSLNMNLCVGSLRGTTWGSRSFFHRLNLCWFLQPEVVGTYLPGTGTGLGGLVWGWDSLLPRPARSASARLLPVWMDVVSLIP